MMCGFRHAVTIGLAALCCYAGWFSGPSAAFAADRITCFFPLPSDGVADVTNGVGGERFESFEQLRSAGFSLPCGRFDQPTSFAAGGAGKGKGRLEPEVVQAWRRYLRVWLAHHRDPSNSAVRQFFGLPPESALTAVRRRGRSAPRELGWRPGTYQQIETPHFQLFSRATDASSQRIAEDLERAYWIWTQAFFPLWEGSRQVSIALGGLAQGADLGEGADETASVAEYLSGRSVRVTTARKMKVVLFRDAAEYQATLGRHIPGIEQSTGFYSDQMAVTFLYATELDDAATRRHELVHQMFREATRSQLQRNRPGEQRDFWLVEGIAGYFESLWIGPRRATIGGWDSPRLQFARHRVLVAGDRMPWEELRSDGLAAAQRRPDLARWYAHAIAHTHRLLDDEPAWVLAKLAELYEISLVWANVPSDSVEETSTHQKSPPPHRSLEAYLRIDDQRLMENRVERPLRELSLSGCEVTEAGLASLPSQSQLRWLDLSRLPIGDAAVIRLVPDPSSLQQLNLEATRITPELAPWIRRAQGLQELDLSWTLADDQLLESLPGDALETLWLTGTRVSDDSLARLGSWNRLRSLDLQRTRVSDRGLQRFRDQRPEIDINPLELRTE